MRRRLLFLTALAIILVVALATGGDLLPRLRSGGRSGRHRRRRRSTRWPPMGSCRSRSRRTRGRPTGESATPRRAEGSRSSSRARRRCSLSASGAKGKGVALALRFLGANPQRRHPRRARGAGQGQLSARERPSQVAYRPACLRACRLPQPLARRGHGLPRPERQAEVRVPGPAGARVSDIRLAYRGVKGLSLEGVGNLLVETTAGVLTDTGPLSYQLVHGKRVHVASRFALDRRGAYGFAVGRGYDQRFPLVIDPGLLYSTFLGGTDYDPATPSRLTPPVAPT